MLTLFKKTKDSKIESINLAAIVDEIHEQTRILSEKSLSDSHAELNNIEVKRNEVESKIQKLRDIIGSPEYREIEQLKSIGFNIAYEVNNLESLTKEVSNLNTKISNLKEIERLNKSKIELYKWALNEFPTNKILFAKDVDGLLNKYGLFVGSISDFGGSVPEKNRKEIIAFNRLINDHDRFSSPKFMGDEKNMMRLASERIFNFVGTRYIEKREYLEYKKDLSNTLLNYLIIGNAEMFNDNKYKSIADMYYKNMTKIEATKKIPDPIVLKPVIIDVNKHIASISIEHSYSIRNSFEQIKSVPNIDNIGFLVVSKWGNEKNIGEIQNESMN